MKKLRIFVSSVQKELDPERLAIAALITTDPFLSEYTEPVLFDKEPISGRKLSKPYLACLDSCDIYLLMISREYGRRDGQLSATHHEYRHAQKKHMPTLTFVKGQEDDAREIETKKFFEEIKADGYTYKRFIDRLDLRSEIRASLKRLLKDEYKIVPTDEEDKSGEETLEAISLFETTQTEERWSSFDQSTARDWLLSIGDIAGRRVAVSDIQNRLHTRALLWCDRETGDYSALAAGILFLGKNPSARFPHCRILADAYKGVERDPTPRDQATISAPAPKAVQAVVDFVYKNTRHPPRIVGLHRVILNEYPEEAVREAIVNAIAHRNYEDKARQILVEVFFDKVVISSPGLPPKPLTLSKLRSGKYLPCSRNPVLAQCLASLNLMEQRGSGLGRIKSLMLDHGLDAPEFDIADGYFQLTLC
ncbi:MAG: ATP-binding protein, partial [bacterium]